MTTVYRVSVTASDGTLATRGASMVADATKGAADPTPRKLGGEVPASTSHTGWDWPATAALADGGFVVAWTASDPDGAGILLQRFDGQGAPSGAPLLVNTGTTNEQNAPTVAPLADGGFVVLWQSLWQDGSWYGIYGQRFAADGTRLGGEFRLNERGADGQNHPSVALLADGSFVATWMSDAQDGSNWSVVARRFSAQGVPLSGDVLVNSVTADAQEYPTVAALAGGGYVVTWQSLIQGGTDRSVFAQRFGADGRKLGGEIQVDTRSVDEQARPAVTALADGGFVVTWQSALQDGSDWGVFAQRFGADGTRLGPEFQVNTESQGDQTRPAVTALADGGFVVAWMSFGQDGSGYAVIGQRFAADGTRLGGEFQLNTVTDGPQVAPVVAALAGGGFVAAWQSLNPSTDTWTLQVQRFETPQPNEAPAVTSPERVPFAENGVARAYQASAIDPEGDAVTWRLSGPDAALFEVDAATGAVRFKAAPDAERPADTGGDNVYDITIIASDGDVTASRAVAIAVEDVAEGARNPTPQRLGGEVQVHSHVGDNQFIPSIAALVGGGFVATWSSVGPDGSVEGIFGQRFDTDGVKVGGEFQVNTYTADVQTNSTVTALADGGFVVTWQSRYQDGDSYGVYGQRFGADGAASGGEFAVTTWTAGGQESPAIAALADGGFVVTWSSFGQDGSGWGIYGQRFDAAGSRAGAEFRVNAEVAGEQAWPSAAALPGGGFAVAWVSYSGQDGSTGGVFAQLFGPDGAKVGGEFQVNTYVQGWQGAPAVVALADGSLVIAWDSEAQDGSGYGIFAQRFSATGEKLGAEFQVHTQAWNDQGVPAMAALADGGFVVSWEAWDQDGSSMGVFGQRFAADATRLGGQFVVNEYVYDWQGGPTLAALPDGGFVAAWHSAWQDGDGLGIFAQRFEAATPNKPPVVAAPGSVPFAENADAEVSRPVATDPEGDALAWTLGGVDAALFEIDPASGAVRFRTLPDFEAPADAGGDNVYDITLLASDGDAVAAMAVSVAVADANDAPGGLTLSTTTVLQSQASVIGTLAALDQDASDMAGFELVAGEGDADNALFAIGAGGALVPAEGVALRAGSYSVRLQATDGGGLSFARAVAFTVVDDVAPAMPDVLITPGPLLMGGATIGIAGRAEAGAAIRVIRDADADGIADPGESTVAAGQVDPVQGSFFLNLDLDRDVTSRFLVVAEDAAGNVSAAAPVVVRQVTAPVAFLSVTAQAAEVAEGNSGTREIVFTVSRTGDLSIPVAASWQAAATPGSLGVTDYAERAIPSGRVQFAAGQASAEIRIAVLGDRFAEADERLAVAITDPSIGAAIVAGSAETVVLNDDGAALNRAPTGPKRLAANVRADDPAQASVSGSLLAGVTDRDGDIVFVSAVRGIASEVQATRFGTIVWDAASGDYTYTLDGDALATQRLKAGATATDQIAYRIEDGRGGTLNGILSVTVTGTNDAPVARNLAAEVDLALESPRANGRLLAGAVDPDGDALRIASVGGESDGSVAGLYGTLTWNAATGAYAYVADPMAKASRALGEDAIASEQFAVVVADQAGATGTATLTVSVRGVNDAPFAFGWGRVVSAGDAEARADGNLLDGVFDYDRGDQLSLVRVEGGAGASSAGRYGTLTWDAATGAATYVLADNAAVRALRAGETAQDVFAYTVRDTADAMVETTATFVVVGANDDATIAGQAAATVTEDVTGFARGRLRISDPDLEEAVFRTPASLAGAHGTFRFDAATGEWSYTLNGARQSVQALGAGQTLTDRLTVQSFDGSAHATVEVAIRGTNDVPVAAPQAAAVDASGSHSVSGNLLAGATDRDAGAVLAIRSAGGATEGSAQGRYGTLTWDDVTGAWTYDLDAAASATRALRAGATATEVFRFVIEDEQGATASSELRVTVRGANDPATIGGLLGGTLAEDQTRRVSGTLTITDPDVGDAVFARPATLAGEYGTFALNRTTGAWSYGLDNRLAATQALAAGQVVTDELPVASRDGSATARIVVSITGVNDAPTAAAAFTAVSAGGVTTASGSLLAGAADVDAGASLRVASVNGAAAGSVAGTYGRLEWTAASGSYGYVLNGTAAATLGLRAGEEVLERFRFVVADEWGAAVSQVLTIAVTGADDPATITGGSTATIDASQVASVGGQLFVTDPDVGQLGFAALGATAGRYGDFSFSPQTGAWSYRLDVGSGAVLALPQGTTATDEVVVRSLDGSATRTLAVTIRGLNDAPVAADQRATVTEGGVATVGGSLLAGARDADLAAVLSVIAVQGGQGTATGTFGDLSWDGQTGTFLYTLDNARAATNALNASTAATERFAFTLSDERGATSGAVLTVVVVGSNDSATITGVSGGAVAEDGTSVVRGRLIVADPDAGESGFAAPARTAGSYGDLAFDTATGAWSYVLQQGLPAVQRLAQGSTGTDSFTIASRDGSARAEVTITIAGANDAPVAAAQAGAVRAEDSAQSSWTGNFLAGATDADDGAVLRVVSVAGGTGTVEGVYGRLEWSADGAFIYVLDNARPATDSLAAGAVGEESFAFVLADQHGAEDEQTLRILVTGAGDGSWLL